LEIGLTKSIDAPLISLEEKEIKRKLQENKKLIEVFRKCVNRVHTKLKKKYIFLLMDSEGYLLDILYNKKYTRILLAWVLGGESLLGRKAVGQMLFHWL
jgi:transcriptional regulator of acetoin/glycerol metabolism